MTFHPIYSLFLTLFIFLGTTQIQTKLRAQGNPITPWINPVLITIALLATGLSFMRIDYATYLKGTNGLTLLLYPATVSLALPLHRNLPHLKKHFFSIISGILLGVLANAFTILILSTWFNLDKALKDSLLPKSVTTPIGLNLSAQLGGIPEVTVPIIVITGIIGIVLGPITFKYTRIWHPVAKGISLGSASHALGTTRAIELGELEGSMSGLAIGITGLVTAILLPLIALLF